MLKVLKKGEASPRTVTVDVKAKTVTRLHVTEAHGERLVACNWTFDFASASDAAILELASRSVLIGSRPAFRAITDDKVIEKLLTQTIDVGEFMSRERGPQVITVSGMVNRAGKLSAEDRKKLMDELKAMDGKK